MNKLITLILCIFLYTGTQAQIFAKGETKIAVNKYGDTILLMHLSDARLILSDLLDRKIVDSIIVAYQSKDSTSNYTIGLYKKQIDKLQEKSENQDLQIDALQALIDNNDKEIKNLNNTIKVQKKEITKQRRLKGFALSAAIIFPIAVLLMKL